MFEVYGPGGLPNVQLSSRIGALLYARGLSIRYGHADVWQWERVGTPTVGLRRIALFRRGWRVV